MRHPDVRTVQSIAILGMLFNNLGDHDLCQTLWACAVRISLNLGLNQPRAKPFVDLSQEFCTRLWWTMLICDWLPFPGTDSLIAEEHNSVAPLPSPQINEEHIVHCGRRVYAIDYHTFMARSATVCRKFAGAVHRRDRPRIELVRRADEQLADIIAALPEHLQPELSETSTSMSEIEVLHPWLRWQRVNVTLVLLTHRLFVHLTLRNAWQQEAEKYRWAKIVSLQTAKNIIFISRNWELPAANRRQWALAYHLYKACALLISEASSGSTESILGAGWEDDVLECVAYLEEIRQWNVIAGNAADTLRRLLETFINS